jgi:hypothetical protein
MKRTQIKLFSNALSGCFVLDGNVEETIAAYQNEGDYTCLKDGTAIVDAWLLWQAARYDLIKRLNDAADLMEAYLVHGDVSEEAFNAMITECRAATDNLPVQDAPDDDDTDALAKQERQSSLERNIFSEALQARFITVSNPDFVGIVQDIQVRRDLVAQEILVPVYGRDTVITRELYDQDSDFGECLNWMNRNFEFPNWEGCTIEEFQTKNSIPGEPVCMNAIQYKTNKPNSSSGVCAENISMQEMFDATPLGEDGWLLKSGFELYFPKTSTRLS